MERITQEADFGLEDWEETLFFVKSDPNGAYNILDIAKYQGESEFDEILKNVALRLAAYEDTGLEPETVSKIRDIVLDISGNLDRLRELAQADGDGRCVVLPCKVGDTVYVVGTCKEIKSFFDDEYLWPEESNCPFEDSCDAEECEENHIRIFETLVTDFWIGEQNENHPEVFLESISEGKMVSDFGKTVFRDKEEAEAALERMKSNG